MNNQMMTLTDGMQLVFSAVVSAPGFLTAMGLLILYRLVVATDRKR